ncbi:hypothetical protein LEMLEM_LOCUS1985 [Lemmus lemmus]
MRFPHLGGRSHIISNFCLRLFIGYSVPRSKRSLEDGKRVGCGGTAASSALWRMKQEEQPAKFRSEP